MSKTEYLPAKFQSSLDKFMVVWGLMSSEEKYTGKQWYPIAHYDCLALSRLYNLSLWDVCSTVSIVSPALKWTQNIKVASLVIEASKQYSNVYDRQGFLAENGVPRPYGWANYLKALDVLDGTVVFKDEGSPKTWRFAQNLFDPNHSMEVTVDSHMERMGHGSRLSQTGPLQFSRKQYMITANHIVHIADITGYLPSEIQAGLWQKHLDMIATDTLPNMIGLTW